MLKKFVKGFFKFIKVLIYLLLTLAVILIICHDSARILSGLLPEGAVKQAMDSFMSLWDQWVRF